MNLYTSNYSNIKNIPKDYTLISISGWIPEEIKTLVHTRDTDLAPSRDIYDNYKKNKNEAEYTRRFVAERLIDIDLFDTIDDWYDEFGSDNIVLLCYEKPEEFCHRHIVAEAIEKEFRTTVKEIGCEDWVRTNGKMENPNESDADFLF